jgi:hypothetical protein
MRTNKVPLLAVLLIFLGYLVIYVITPYDLNWHLSTSLDRLILQIFPAVVYLVIKRKEASCQRTGGTLD